MRNTVAACGFGVRAAVMLAFIGVAAAPTPASAADAGKKNITFAKDVAPILQQKCQVCHHPGAMGPMSLMTYEQARPWARSIRKRVAEREMPPWHIDKTIGIQQYKNDRSLSDEQMATILAWVDAGAPLGNPKDLPAPLTYDD